MIRPGRALAAILVCLPVIAFTQSAPQPPTTNDPFPTPIEATAGVIAVNYQEFATIPDVGTAAPRMMMFADQPGTKRLFVSTMTGVLYAVSYDGKTVAPYLDVNAAEWATPVQSQGAERGFQSFAFHPQFSQRGTPGYGKFYTYTDTSNTVPAADFSTPGPNRTHDTVLLEWSAKDPAAAAYDGGAPRELFRAAQPFSNHNGGEIAFNPLARAGSADFGLMYVGLADGGSGGDPFNVAQNMASPFGKILRIDPLGKNSTNGKYGVPASNPFVKQPGAMPEIYALGVRNPQRFSWDAKNGQLFVADIGQNVVEEVSPVTAGANLGWNVWEASFQYVNRQVTLEKPRSAAGMTWPIVEFDHRDPLFSGSVAVTGVYVYRATAIPQLAHLMLFGDNPSGEIFYIDADAPPSGGQAAIRRILFNDGGEKKTLLQLIQAKNTAQGKPPSRRADLRLGVGPNSRLFVLNKRDGVIREIVK